MGKLGIKQRAGRLLSVLLAFALPGLGHVRNGQYARGFLLLAGLLLDYVAIFRLADSDGGRHLLLIVYLVLLLPVFYFISVFEVLQFDHEQKMEGAPLRLKDGLGLTLAGVFMMILLKPPAIMLPWMNELAEWSVGPLLILVSLLWLRATRKGEATMFRLGRMTACMILLAIGALLLWDHLRGRNDIAVLRDWWPVVFVFLGIEIILYSTLLKRRASGLRLDAVGMAASLVIAVTAYAVTQYADFPVKWLDQFNVDLNGRKEYAEENGFRFDKNVMKVPFDESVESLRIENANGDIHVRSGDVNEIEIYTTIWVDLTDEAEAKAVADQSIVHAAPGTETVLEGKGQSYGANGNRLPKMNVEIIIPKLDEPQEDLMGPPTPPPEEQPDEGLANGIEETNGDSLPRENSGTPVAENSQDSTIVPQESDEAVGSGDTMHEEEAVESDSSAPQGDTDVDQVQDGPVPGIDSGDLVDSEEQRAPGGRALKLNINSGNGSVTVMDVHAKGGVLVRSGSGLVQLTAIHGDILVEGINASLEAYSIHGQSSLVTKNGSIKVESATDDVFASTMNGNLELIDIYGDLDSETKNGGIRILNAAMDIKANTLNGNVDIDSPVVGGNWDLDSSVGEINLRVPYSGSYAVYGSVTFGNITTDLPLDQTRKTLRGVIGDGDYRIHINATNSISIHGQGL
ncbi:hypothetical protein D3P07_26590 [Paenibacillus sp. 1011MAR3C5]|uniref:DUF4097 family beta strand repeat-containing protein n=1 Tax=Paenibacillus sp. 1011MAR3C5 TaxID=1675787 RepID=UPI000E6C2E9D|nr:DUF4097 family beta strand repeat-containing protein [Paenibacillus sp. 1011MAR3C5]RJE82622.1 hypothetical protein D3P07_26590 [Paenibacillus sp. 1011MAR3C5]